MARDSKILEELYEVVEARKNAPTEESYTAHLYKKGTGKICQKVGEEATEVIVDAMKLRHGDGKKKHVAEESADLLYHLLVLWADLDIKPEKIWKVLDKRFIKNQKKD